MNILILSHQSPLPENHGFARRVMSTARALARRGHSIWILAPSSDLDSGTVRRLSPDIEFENLELIEVSIKSKTPRAAQKLMGLLFKARDSHRILREAMKLHMKHKIDIVQLERPYLLGSARVLRRLGIPLVLISHFIEQDSALDLQTMGDYTEQQVRETVRIERTAVELADLVLAVSQEDARMLREFYCTALGGVKPRIEVLSNGIDCDAYKGVKPHRFPKPTVLFIGSGFHYPNKDAMWQLDRQIISQVRRRHRNIDFAFIGPELPGWLKPRYGVTVLGAVDDVRPYVLGSAVCVAPVRYGTGSLIKMLEYMAGSRAIVASPKACFPFKLRDGEHAIVRHRPRDFADAIIQLVKDKAKARKLGRAAFALCHEKYDWKTLAKELEKKYERFVA